jgi:hypothetical protein
MTPVAAVFSLSAFKVGAGAAAAQPPREPGRNVVQLPSPGVPRLALSSALGPRRCWRCAWAAARCCCRTPASGSSAAR